VANYDNNRELAYSMLRIIYGVVFVTTGTSKFLGGIGNFVAAMNQSFAGKLPAAVVMPFAFAIPFCEVIAGALILIGLFTRIGLTITGLLLIGLTFGVMWLGDATTVAHNLQYALINFVLLWFVDLNRYSLDAVLGRRTPAGFAPAN
jgi:thiosulfate dehydrogenase (quinone) large subunit